MPTTVTTTVTELPESRVRVEAEIPADEVERRVQQAARRLGSQLRIPGFRKGKVPPPVVLRRLGREAVFDEALQTALAEWYTGALDASQIVPVGGPDFQPAEPPAQGEALTLSFEIGVRPTATLGEYKGLEVGRREPEIDAERVDEQIEAMREHFGSLENVERPAAEGDSLVADYVGKIGGDPFDGGTARDQLIELGAGRLIPGFEDQLIGATAGEQRTIHVTFPEDYPNSLGGQDAEFDVTIHEVKAKNLPELDDDFAAEASDFETLAELRSDIETKLREADEQAIEREFEEAVLQAAADNATVDTPEALVHARAHELVGETLQALARQGIPRETYFQITGKNEHELSDDAEPEAATALRREAVLAAIVEAEKIEPTDEELVQALAPAAERDGSDPAALVEQLREAGRIDQLRYDVASRQALELLVKAAKPISVQAAKAKDALWTPGKGDPTEDAPAGSSESEASSGSGSTELWTPGN
jgi:trigger factor